MPRRWSDDEIETLREMWPSNDIHAIAEELERSPGSISAKACRLGLEKPDNYRALKSLRNHETLDVNDEEFAYFIAGFIAGEGHFGFHERADSDTLRFKLAIEVAQVDSDVIEEIADFFDAGKVYRQDARRETEQPCIEFRVDRIGALAKKVIPFYEEYGREGTDKWDQFTEWRDKFYEVYDLDPSKDL